MDQSANLDPSLGPCLDAAVAAMQSQAQPMRARPTGSPIDRRLEPHAWMVRIGGDAPVARHSGAVEAIARLGDGLAIEGDLHPIQAYPILECPAGATVDAGFEVAGWAFKDGVGLERVEITLDGKTVAEARYGLDSPGVARYWRISTDPNHPRVGFEATVDATASGPGAHWLGLRLHGRDGSVEAWPELRIEIR